MKRAIIPENRINRRFIVAIICLIVAFVVVTGRLLWIVVVDGEKYSKTALAQAETELVILTAKRGDIIDRNNVTLATSNVTYNLILDPKVILSDEDRYLDDTTALIAKHFGFSADELKEKVYAKSNSSYVVLKKNLSFNDVEEFIKEKDGAYGIAGIWLEESYRRNYSFGTLASSVVGFTSQGKGLYGLEYEYDRQLTGVDGREYTYVNSDNIRETERKEAQNGYTIQSTIDYNMQTIVETKIQEFMQKTQSKTVSVIIQNPNTGEIYAMADSDNFDCNNPWDLTIHYSQEEIDAMSDEEVTNILSENWKNFCITESYEPGSTFKPFTLAACLEENAISMNDTYNCTGYVEFQDDTVKCHNNAGHGILDTKNAIAESCNVALMSMGASLGATNFCKYQRKFGFGKGTGIDLPNEVSCKYLLYKPEEMIDIDLATNSFGQNFNLTMIQLSTAFCSLVNGGYYYQPYIVKGIYNDSGELIESTDRILISRTISEHTSDLVKQCLRRVVTSGTGDYAQIDGYVISGKTGTAEKSGREDGKYVVSFIGFAPYENPEVVCYVVIDEPESGDEHGVSSTLFNMIMTEILPYMNVTPAIMDKDPEGGNTKVTSIEEQTNGGSGEEYAEDDYYDEEYDEEEYYEDDYEYNDGEEEEY